MKTLYFTNFYGKLRFPIFPTLRMNVAFWKESEGKQLHIAKGSWRRPREAKRLGVGTLLVVKPYMFGSIPAEFIEFDTDLKFLDAEDLFMQMHRTEWKGSSTEVALLLFFWNKRFDSFYAELDQWRKSLPQKKKEVVNKWKLKQKKKKKRS